MTRCDLCGTLFDPAASEPVCRGCPLAKGCQMVRCPRCGYEMLPEPRLVKFLRGLKKNKSTKSESIS